MTTGANESTPAVPEASETHLCLGCTAPNHPMAHWCKECGAPLSGFAATAPWESPVAMGHFARNVTEQPYGFLGLLFVWSVCGALGLAGLTLLAAASRGGPSVILLGAVLVLVSGTILWKTTQKYLASRKTSKSPV